MKILLLSTILIASALTACTEAEKPLRTRAGLGGHESPSLNSSAPPPEPTPAPKAVSAADKKTPEEKYKLMHEGRHLIIAYHSVDSSPIDFEGVVSALSEDYRRQSDEFKKRDIVAQMKPDIESRVASAKENRYYYMDMSSSLEKYEFNNKSFLQTGLEGNRYTYFDNSIYRLTLINGDSFKNIKVEDENIARGIESKRSKYTGLTTRVYFYAHSTELGSPKYLNGEVVKVKILDEKGNVMFVAEGA